MTTDVLGDPDDLCEVCGERLMDFICPNDNAPYHDVIQFEIWDEQGVRGD
jgi:hypothetical protein